MGLGKFVKQSTKIMKRAGEAFGEGASLALDPRRIGDRAELLGKGSKYVFDIGTVKKAITKPSPSTVGLAALEVGALLPAGRIGKFALWASKAEKAAKAARTAEEINVFAHPTRAAANRAVRFLSKKRAAEAATRRVGWLLPK